MGRFWEKEGDQEVEGGMSVLAGSSSDTVLWGGSQGTGRHCSRMFYCSRFKCSLFTLGKGKEKSKKSERKHFVPGLL